VDITLGGSPCPGFSNLNQTEENQKTRSLLPICVKLGIVLGSDVIIMENAPGAKETREMRDAVKALKHNGYSVQCDVLTAADYGVPQKRKRTILVGTRGEWSFTWPATVARHVTVNEALSVPPVPVHGPQVPQEIKEKAEGTRPKSFESAYRTIDVDKPASTVTTQKQMLLFCRGGEFFYPSVAEYLRLQSFPTEFGFPGPVSETKRYEMIGNAVPPKLAAAIAGGLHRRLPSGQVPSPDPDSANAGMAEMVGDLPGRAGERVLVPNPAAVGPSDTPPETQHPIRAPAASCRGRNGGGKGGKGGGGREKAVKMVATDGRGRGKTAAAPMSGVTLSMVGKGEPVSDANALLRNLHAERQERLPAHENAPSRASTSVGRSGVHTLAQLPIDESELICGDCGGRPTLSNPLIRCFYGDKPEACRKAWHKYRCCDGRVEKAKYVCCMGHYKLFEKAYPGAIYTCPDCTDATLPPIPPPPTG